MWLAPNLITLAGLLAVVLSYWMIVVFQPNFEGSSPSWVMIYAGIAVVLYANLDCIDGKQTRRTGTSSPLGQLFYHGCDAYIVHLIVGNMIACLGESCGWRAAIGSLAIMCPWILAQLEEYHTGVMLYGNGIWGVMEALYSTALLNFATAIIGNKYWKVPIHDLVPIPLPISVVDLVLVFISITGVIQSSGQIWRTLTSDGSKMGVKEKGEKRLGLWNACSHLMVIGIVLSAGFVWILMSDQKQCRLVYTAYGTFFAPFATQLIVAHMAKTTFQPSWFCLFIFLVCTGNSVVPFLDPLLSAIVVCLVFNVLYFYRIYILVQQICKYLGIWCLIIKKNSLKD
eukprot:g4199.t1